MYTPKLTLIQTERALKEIKTIFEKELSEALNLTRISAPLFVSRESGLNDDLNGVERPVSFDVKATGEVAEVVHSLAKWKRYALAKYRFGVRFGLYTDMNAIRRDEDLDNLHSVYVDQWDWEAVIRRNDRTIEFLQATVKKIYAALQATAHAICTEYPALDNYLSDEICIPTSPPNSARRRTSASTAPPSSCRSAASCARAKSTTAGRPTMTTGLSTATSSSIIPCSTAPSRSRPWASA